MNRTIYFRVPGALYKRISVMFVVALIVSVTTLPLPARSAAGVSPLANRTARTQAESELFGMVIRDPFYEYNSDPVNFHEAPNRVALERQVIELAAAGVKWIRMEFFADYDGTVKPGEINWSKYDWFIRELAPKYDLKVLALLNVGIVSHEGQTLRALSFNDPPDGGGSDPGDGSNHFIRVFTGRAQGIAAHYGSAISAYEIVNEPNISYDLWNDTKNGSAEIKPDRYAALIASAYRAIKGIEPGADVITGGMLIGSPPEGKDHDQFDYLYQVYTSPWVERYQASGLSSRTGWSRVPWDGVGIHPYHIEPYELFILLKEFSRKLLDRGDYHSKLWITEVGTQGDPPDDVYEPPTDDEVRQAQFLRTLYTGILTDNELLARIAHVFWFKYEDFVPGNYTHNYGLVRLQVTPSGKEYHPSGRPWVHKLAYKVYQEIALGYSLTDPVDEFAPGVVGRIYFPETRQAIAPEFLAYWQDKGGLGRFGYPITRPVVLRSYVSQIFERAVFEYHPEYDGTPNVVLLRLLGNEYTLDRSFEAADPRTVLPDRIFMQETAHTLGGAFRKTWEETGGLAVYGYPISEEIIEVSPTDGKEYLVQYFERNRFEYHPESAGTPYEVQLGLLGANLLKTDLWWR